MKRIISGLLVVLLLSVLVGCSAPAAGSSFTDKGTTDFTWPKITVPAQTTIATDTPETTEPPATTEAPKITEPTEAPKEDGKLRTDFKEAMDSYEDFMDEYIAFMKKYNANPSDLTLLADYVKFMGEYTECMEKFEKWESEDLNAAEMAYYLEVQLRVNKKLQSVL